MAELTSVVDAPTRPAPSRDPTPRPYRSGPQSGRPNLARLLPATPRPSPRWTELVLFLYAPFLAATSLTFASSPDDPFITLRYAANLVHGDGLAFNAGQYVQGFTSPLHLLVTVVLYLAPGGHDLLKLKLASLVFGFLAVRQGGRLLYGLALPRWAQRTGCVALAGSWVVAFASGNGLETTLAMWLLMMLARRLVLDGPRRSPIALFLLALAAVLARPDALLAIAFMAMAGLLIERPIAPRRRINWFGGALLAAVGVAGAGAVYFGSPLPNTYFAKDLAPGRAVRFGLDYIVNSLQPGTSSHAWTSLPDGLLFCQALFLIVGLAVVVRRFPRCGYLVAVVAAQTLFILKSGGDWMVGGRFLAPAILPLTMIEVLGVVGLALFISRHVRPGVARGALTGMGAILLASGVYPLVLVHAPVWQISGADDASLLRSGHYDQLSRIWTALPQEVACLRPGQLVATTEVGFLGFERPDLRILDLRGLTNHAIATSAPASEKFPYGVEDPNWFVPGSPVGRVILQQNPALIAIFDSAPRPSILGGAYRLTRVTLFGPARLSLYAPSDLAPGPCGAPSG